MVIVINNSDKQVGLYLCGQAFSQGPKRGRPILVQRYIYSKEGAGVEKTFLWKTFEVYVTSYQYLFQARSKFFTWLCEY